MLVVRLCQTGRVMSRWSGYAEVVSYLNGIGLSRHGQVTSAWPSSYIARLIYGRVISDWSIYPWSVILKWAGNADVMVGLRYLLVGLSRPGLF
jgi:hypothetical protein